MTLGADELDSVDDGTTVEDDGSSGSETTGTTTGAMPLPCDPGFVFTPDPPGTGALLNVAFTDPSPLAYVDLQAAGPGSATIGWAGITTNDPWTWNWTVTSLSLQSLPLSNRLRLAAVVGRIAAVVEQRPCAPSKSSSSKSACCRTSAR